MSENYQDLERFTNKRYSEILRAGFSFFAKNWLKLLLPFASFLVISMIIKDLIVVDLNWQNILLTPQLEFILEKDPAMIDYADLTIILQYLSNIVIIAFLDSLIRTIIGVFSMCLFGSYIFKKFIGNTPRLSSELKSAFNVKIIGVLLLLGLGVSLGTFLIFIPSILIIGFYPFFIFTYHSKSIQHPLKQARNIAKRSFWKVIGIFVISNIIIWILTFVYQLVLTNTLVVSPTTYNSWFNPASRNIGMIILYNILYGIIEILLSPLFICLLCSLYVHLSSRKKDGQIISEQNADYAYAKQSYVATTSTIDSAKKGFYCPFCGNYISVRKQFCPNCGEKLDFEL